jgi:hypothetical protein
MIRRPQKRFSAEEDELIKNNIKDDDAQNLRETFRKTGIELNRPSHSIKNRYYLKREDWEPLFIYVGKNIRYNTKNCGKNGKGRENLLLKDKVCTLKYHTVSFNITF